MHSVLSVIRFSHENPSDYDEDDRLNSLYTDTTFKCELLKMLRFTILGVYRDILHEATECILIFSFFLVFFGEI